MAKAARGVRRLGKAPTDSNNETVALIEGHDECAGKVTLVLALSDDASVMASLRAKTVTRTYEADFEKALAGLGERKLFDKLLDGSAWTGTRICREYASGSKLFDHVERQLEQMVQAAAEGEGLERASTCLSRACDGFASWLRPGS